MKNIDNTKSGVQLKSIFLEHSVFCKKTFEENTNNHGFNINISYTEVATNIHCKVAVEIKNNKEVGRNACGISATFVGIFEIIGQLDYSIDAFVRINAASIIYPYIRQHIRNLTLDAGLNPIMIPVVNFQMAYEQKLFVSKKE